MDLFRLLFLSAVLAPVSCSPVELHEPPKHWTVEGESPIGNEGITTPITAPTAGPGFPLTSAPSAVIGRREALNLDTPAGTVIFQPLPAKGCTTTVTETYGFPCEWNGTTTVYPTTTIQFRQVNCNGCDSIYVSKSYYYCPNQKINATRTMDIPSTYWSTICRPSTALGLRDQQQHMAAPTAVPEAGARQTAVPAPNPPLTALPTPNS
ncbi:hypothetical protein C8A03DRAFT_33210 [Achaetomium macrosporum]|uniref:Uncharacterized protein n=1 Tax=Achaetomium macrosporum TaxID=79813 RepID=A0AAN7CBJ4_9PEZI|nr:hypothetical protein C8A03DRAFT_33210 [Achaetomium macrosporum]